MNYKDYDSKFQTKLLALLVRDKDFLTRHDDVILPKYFPNPNYTTLATIIERYFRKHHTTPTHTVIENELNKLVEKGFKLSQHVDWAVCFDLNKQIFTLDFEDADYVKGEAINFAQKQSFHEALLSAGNIWNNDGDYDSAKKLIEESLKVGMDKNDLGSFYLKDYKDRFQARIDDDVEIPRVQLAFSPTLNNLCSSGLGPEELWVILAATNRGKSSFLMNIAFSALQQNKRVVYYSFEMSPKKIGARIDSRMGRIPGKSLRDETPILEKKITDHICTYKESELVIKFYPRGMATVNTLISHLSLLKGYYNFVPDLVVVDYADIMSPIEKSSEKRHQQANIYGELFYMAQTQGIPIVTGCQSNRAGQLKETVDLTEAGESYEKVQIADVVLSLNETQEEYQNNKTRVFVAKNRDDKKWDEVQLTFDRATAYINEEEDDIAINSLL